MTLLTFPPLAGLIYPVARSPMFSTVINRSVSGKVNALQMMSAPLYTYKVGYSFLRAFSPHVEFQTLEAFFLQVGGRAKAFQFNDIDNMTATAQGFGIGDGVSTDFQLVYTRAGGAFSFAEPVYVPLTVTEIEIAGAPTADYTIEPGGIIRFGTAPGLGNVLTWTGTFNWLVRFTDDAADFEKFADKFWRLNEISFASEPL